MRSLNGGEGLPKVRCRMTPTFGHLCIPRSTVCGPSMHIELVRLAAGSKNVRSP